MAIEFPRGGFDNELPTGAKKLPCALLVDTSGSMGAYEDDLKVGVKSLIDALQGDFATAAVVEVMLVFFDDSARIVHPFTNVRSLEVPEIETGGTTHIFEALDLAYSEIRVRQEQYKKSGINSYAPFIVVLTDGHPVGDTDMGIVSAIRKRNEDKKLVPYPFAMGGEADEALLKSLRNDGMAFRVDMENLKDIFEFVSVSLSSIASDVTSVTNDQLPATISII
ncbi:MAG: VWA domain-containing protein [Coriobacteriales bacterium]|nr:VWA domain-containing protein [Coriobacteriales bacterium]